MRKRIIKVGDQNFPVAYNMNEFAVLEKHFEVPLSELFQKIQANLSIETIRVLVKTGLEGGEYAQGKEKVFEWREIDELLSGRILPVAKQFMEAAAEDMGLEFDKPDEKNLKARK